MFKKCGMKFPIVLFSDNDRHLMDSYEINALYLTKTFKKVDIEHCMERIFEITSNANFKLRFEDTTFCSHMITYYISRALVKSLLLS